MRCPVPDSDLGPGMSEALLRTYDSRRHAAKRSFTDWRARAAAWEQEEQNQSFGLAQLRDFRGQTFLPNACAVVAEGLSVTAFGLIRTQQR